MPYDDNAGPWSGQPLSDAQVIAILISDLRVMNPAQLAALLFAIHLDPESGIGHAIEPHVRAELTRRRIIEEIEAIAARA